MPSAWINHVKEYAKKNNCSYKEALSKASTTYKKGSGVGSSRRKKNNIQKTVLESEDMTHLIGNYLSPVDKTIANKVNKKGNFNFNVEQIDYNNQKVKKLQADYDKLGVEYMQEMEREREVRNAFLADDNIGVDFDKKMKLYKKTRNDIMAKTADLYDKREIVSRRLDEAILARLMADIRRE